MNVFITVISNIFLYSTVKMDYKVMNNIQILIVYPFKGCCHPC